MNSAYRVWLALLFLLFIILFGVVQPSEGQRRNNNCDCRYARDSPVCASNGVTYPSMCRFDCAKARVRRLRVVSSGSCRGKSLNDYRRGQRTG